MTDPQSKVLSLLAIATALAQMQHAAEADRVLALAVGAAKSIEMPRDRCQAICAVAAAEQSLGKAERSAATFELALLAARELADPLGKAYCLVAVAERYSESKQGEQAHKVLAEAEKVANKIGAADQQKLALERVHRLMRNLPR